MTKEEILLFGMIVEADIFEDGHGTTKHDEELLQKALFKAYGAKEDSTKEELEKLQHELENDKKTLAKKFREKALSFLED